MDRVPDRMIFEDGTKMWQQEFAGFEAKVYLPATELPADIVNFGFVAPYLMIFEERRQTAQEAKAFADECGLADIASKYAGSVVFFYPAGEDGWESAPGSLYADMIAQSRISQYYQDGAATMYDRFAKKMEDVYIRGAVPRIFVYGFGASADYIVRNCLKTVEGEGLYGWGDITPAACVLQRAGEIPRPERRDIPVLSIGNGESVNRALRDSLDYVLVKDTADYRQDFAEFVGTFRRMLGHLEKEPDYDAMGMAVEPGYCTVKTSPDNRGDDRDTTEHAIGYVAFYNRGIMDEGRKVPLLMCFHGGGDSAMCMAYVSGWYKVAAKYDFLLVCVENHLNSTATETLELIGQLKERYAIDGEKIYASGFSMGGCKSWDMFQEYPEYFAAVAPMDATFEVGLNVSGESAGEINQDTVLPVFYVGGEITPLPELPFQALKCLDRMKYTMKVNRTVKENRVLFNEQDKWENPIWGIDGDYCYRLPDPERENCVLTMQLFVSAEECNGGAGNDAGATEGNSNKNNKCYCIFGSVSNQAHEVRHIGCENAWKFMSCFRRLADGTLLGGELEEIRGLYGQTATEG